MKRILTLSFLIVTLVIGSAFVNNDKLFEITKNLEVFTKAYQELNANYVDEIDPGQLMKVGIDAMMDALDPYTRFYSSNQIERYRFLTEGKYDGMGARAAKIGDYLTILEPYEGFAADEAGLKAGDKIIKVAGQDAVGKPEEEIRAMFRGAAGTSLPITVQSYGSKKMRGVTLNRSEVSMPNVPYSGMVNDQIGYIVLTTFTQQASKNISKAYNKLKEENPNLSGLIIDLRNNGGGLLREAIQIVNLFLPAGEEVVTTKGKVRERDKSFKTTKPPLNLEIPLAILINKRSASASEIVSGVIQDMDRGVVIGQRSFGKGLVQNQFTLGYNNNMKITTSKYYIPSGRCIQSAEYKDGEPVDIPDDQRAVFYTKNGRAVLDGGGVTPDVPMNIDNTSSLIAALEKDYVIFNFVNDYTQNLDEIGEAQSYRFTDYDAFKAYLNKTDFSFESPSEKLLNKLEEEPDMSNPALQAQIATLEKELAASKSDQVDMYKDDIIRLIEKEIVPRYHYQKGKIQQQLDTDPELDEAIAILQDPARYNAILAGNGKKKKK